MEIRKKMISREACCLLWDINFPMKTESLDFKKLNKECEVLLERKHDLWLIFHSGFSFAEIAENIKKTSGQKLEFSFGEDFSEDEKDKAEILLEASRSLAGYYLLDMTPKYGGLELIEQEKCFPTGFKRADLSLALEAMESVQLATEMNGKKSFMNHKQEFHFHTEELGPYMVLIGKAKKESLQVEIHKKNLFVPRMEDACLISRKN